MSPTKIPMKILEKILKYGKQHVKKICQNTRDMSTKNRAHKTELRNRTGDPLMSCIHKAGHVV